MTAAVPPRCAERFRPERVLSAGAFGTVWLAHQTSIDRPVALKADAGRILVIPGVPGVRSLALLPGESLEAHGNGLFLVRHKLRPESAALSLDLADDELRDVAT